MKKRTACIALFAVLPSLAQAQAYPTKPIRNIMAVAGGAEIVVRLVAQELTKSMGQPVIVEQQAGAGGVVGAEMVARAAPDGYTILLQSVSTTIMTPFLVKNARLDTLRDFTPLSKAFETVLLVVANSSIGVNSMKELIDYAKRNPGKLSYGTSGVGTSHHLSGEALKILTGIDWVHVPYKGGPPVLTDLVGGQIQVGFTILATAGPFMKNDKMKLLAVNNAARSPVIPDVPTVSEQVPGYEPPPAWGGYFAPAGLPQPLATRLHDEIARALSIPEVRAKAQEIGFVAGSSTPEEMVRRIKGDVALVSRIVAAVGIKPE
jgi:tripartite-type tricarboxylate transporter receptor subunit TctC